MKIETVQISYGKGDVQLNIIEQPLYSVVGPRVMEALCDRLGTVICSPPEWAWEIRWGPKDPQWGIADRSLGHYWIIFGQWTHHMGFRKGRVKVSIPVTREWVEEHFPHPSPDEMTSESSDEGDVLL